MKSAGNFKKVARYAHPVLYLLLPLFALYSSNPGQVLPGNLIRPALLFMIVAMVTGTLLYFATRRNVSRTALCISLFFFAFTSFDLCDMLFASLERLVYWCHALAFRSFPPGSLIPGDRSVWLLGLWSVLTLALFYFCLRIRRDITSVVWLGGVALIILPFGKIIVNEVARYSSYIAIQQTNNKVPSIRTANPPDLYVIVLDTYGRQDILKSMYDLDNEPFLKALESRGFLIARHSRANYIQTPLAIAATLNLDYLPTNPNGSWSTVSPSIDRNQIAALLKQQSYRFLSIPTGFDPTATPSADKILDDHGGLTPWLMPSLTQFEEILLTKTPLSTIPRTDTNSFSLHRKRILGAFDYLGEVASLPYPKFVFAHILAPHPPFVFCADGNPCAPVGQTIFTIEDASSYHEPHDIYKAGYAGQVQFVNKRILASLDAIQAKATRPYVIVLMGDHGARCLTDWGSRENTDVHEAFSNLFAVYTPPDKGATQTPSLLVRRMKGVITPITGLRLVLNEQFGTNYPDLPDRSFYSTMGTPLLFNEVTADLDVVPEKLPQLRGDSSSVAN